MQNGNKKLFIAAIGLIVTLVLGLTGTMWGFAQDRQQVAVTLESLAGMTKLQAAEAGRQASDINDIKSTLRILVDQNAHVAVLQHQVADLQRRLDKAEVR